MQLHDFISDLIYRYDCVVVPGFGAFLSQQQPSKSHELSHAFYPPSKQLSFNSQLTNNDGLLANHMVLLEGISYEAPIFDKSVTFVVRSTDVPIA